MTEFPVCIAGGGPVGMTLAIDLASRGIRCVLLERNQHTTRHPKMDITNARTMELFRHVGLVPALRAVAIPESHCFDVSWVTSMNGYELHRFRYPSVDDMRRRICDRNDGMQPAEAPMRVSQVEIEPILKAAIDAHPFIDVRFGTAFEEFTEEEDAVVITIRNAETSAVERIRARYLVGCDGGSSRVRTCLDIPLSGEARVMDRFMTHFRSDARAILQRWGVAWHYQSNNGTLIAQNDTDLWTLHSRFPRGRAPADVRPTELLERFVGAPFPHTVLIANAWTPHLVVADAFGRGRVLLAGDAAHQYIPTGGYGMNTGIADAFDLGWKLAAILHGFGGPNLLASYEAERRPVALRNREASRRHNETRIKIAALYDDTLEEASDAGAARRAAAAARIATIGNLENENTAIEFGYIYRSPIVCDHELADPDSDYYVPLTVPGARLPSVFLASGEALYDKLDPWFTLLSFDGSGNNSIEHAAKALGVPLRTVVIDEPRLRSIYGQGQILVRPDHHIAWRSSTERRPPAGTGVIAHALGGQLCEVRDRRAPRSGAW